MLPISAGAESGDEVAIKAVLSHLVKAVEAKDTAAVMKAYVADDSLVVFDMIPPRQYVGAKAFAKHWTDDFFNAVQGPMTFEMSDVSVAASGELAFARNIQRLRGTGIKGQPVDITFRDTMVFRKIKGNWLIVHEHASIPVDPATGQPDFSSKP